LDPFKPYRPKPKMAAVTLSPEDAEIVAFRAVAWIVGDDAMRDRFVVLTGCAGDDLLRRVAEPAFLGATLDFLLEDEASLSAFVGHAGRRPSCPCLRVQSCRDGHRPGGRPPQGHPASSLREAAP
jgi:hypothetical protein